MIRNNQKGFSLVELMIVVAIIGALAMVAVPRMGRLLAKAKVSEAQTNLTSIFTFNRAFHAEFNGYSNCLNCIGFRAEGDLLYNYGWSQAPTAPGNWIATRTPVGLPAGSISSTLGNTAAHCQIITAAPAGATCRTKLGSNNVAPPAIPAADSAIDTVSFATFRAVAVARVLGLTDDIWTINENKMLLNAQIGTE